MSRARLVLPALAAALLLGLGTTAAAASAPAVGAVGTTITQSRLAGPDRYATAVAISKANFVAPQDWVVVASGLNFPDALGAGPMAGLLQAPLLLVPTTGTLPSVVAAELDRLGTRNILVVGGPSAVSTSMVNQLKAHAPANQTFVIAGANRYDTAAQTTEGFDPPVAGVPVFIASGTTFADALGGGAVASMVGGSLLLTTPTSLPAETKAALQRIKPSRVVVLGGTGAISSGVMTQVKSAVGSAVPVSRVAGADRFATAATLSSTVLAKATEVFLANGLSYPDALAGAPVALYDGGRPVLLTLKDCVPQSTLAEISRLGATKVTALGGVGAVSDAALGLKPC